MGRDIHDEERRGRRDAADREDIRQMSGQWQFGASSVAATYPISRWSRKGFALSFCGSIIGALTFIPQSQHPSISADSQEPKLRAEKWVPVFGQNEPTTGKAG